MRVPLFWVRLTQYEYWPWWLFYVPMIPYWFYLSLRTRAFAYFSAVNPGIELGGFFGESKVGILSKISPKYLPKAIEVYQIDFDTILAKLKNKEMDFPLVAKPDIGERGNFVEKITDEQSLRIYHQRADYHYIIQEFIDYPIELGVLYSRMPNSKKGKVSSVTFKEFLTVVGDGNSSILELMNLEVRSRFQIKRLQEAMGQAIKRVPALGEEVLLEPIGNHCRGTRFINYNHLLNERLDIVFDEIALGINGFYYGRFDLKVRSIEDLYRGEHIRIMELNGASSEPGHIYDPSFSLLKAYRDLHRHWKRIADIAIFNMKQGTKPASFSLIVKTYAKFVMKIG